ncbi:MAG TPA: tetratricopeptide repeat protein, partial [Bacteroidia bacterium]|nr:tetratricopeptide repeat protein [Bacteroidia bacterium]
MSLKASKLIAFFGCILVFALHLNAQYSQLETALSKDEKIAHYLSDTLHAGAKMKELNDSATKARDRGDKITAIEDYEIGLALTSYAKDSFNLLTSLYAHIGGLLRDAGADKIAIVYFEKALMENRKFNKNGDAWKYNLLGSIVPSFIKRKEYDSADVFYREAKKVAWEMGKPLWEASAENNIGMLYEKLGKHDSAFNTFICSVKILSASDKEDSLLLGSINDNIAQNYFARNRFDTAEKYYLQNIALFSTLKIPFGIFKAEIGEANCALAMHDYTKELLYSNRAKNCLTQNPANFNATDCITLLECHLRYYLAVGNSKQAFLQQARIDSIKNTLMREQKRISEKLMEGLTEAEEIKSFRSIQLYDLKLQRNKASLAESHRKTMMSFILSLVIILSAAVIISILTLYYRNKQKSEVQLREQKEQLAKSELERQKLEQEKIEQELTHKKADLRNVGMYLSEFKDLQDAITGKLHEIKNQ